VQPVEYDATPGDDALETAIRNRLEDLRSGKYEQNTAYVLRRFANWARPRGVDTVEEIDTTLCRQYARGLSRDVEDGTVSNSTANQYWAYIRSWLSWAVREELIDTNPAKTNTAEEPLPEAGTATERQFWSERERDAICATADTLVDRALDADEGVELAYRNRALVYTLAWSGCRGAELLRSPQDDERTGITWAAVDLAGGTIEVTGKSREREHAPLLTPAQRPLERWYERVGPAPDDNVFPRLDPAASGMDPAPSITTQAARDVLADLCDASDYEFAETLTPHGARRGLGHALYEESAETAQEVLRHKDLATTHDAYRDTRAEQVRQSAEDILLDDSDDS
jgi:integrase